MVPLDRYLFFDKG